MKKRLLTKSDVKNQMVKLFSSTLPELKNIAHSEETAQQRDYGQA